MKKILIMQPFLSYGGAEAVSIQLAYYLKKRGFDAKVMALFKKKHLPLYSDKVEITSLINLSEYLNADMLNPHNFPTLWLAVIIGKIFKIPVVWTVHNFPQSPVNNFLVNWLVNYLDGFFAKRCAKVIAVSDKVKKQIKDLYDVDSTVIHTGVDYEFYSKGDGERIRKKYNWTDKYIILQVARLRKEKNQELSIKVFKKVSKKISNSVLILVGDGEDKDRLVSLSKRHKISDRVLFVGYLPASILRSFYDAADIHLLPSFKTEGFNLAPLEALCTGCVSVVVEGSGVDSFLKKNEVGFVANGTVESFKEKVIYAYKNKGLVSKMGKKGKKAIKQKLTWDKYVDEFERLL